ncbi:DUF4256 domain-containing protein [Luteolibacter sp. SL250]|uniref:DUF4256 domain-containing protein n=1 Tax=Luteolibacter sp. SL250 TaxID=2995170 RepID=UPI00226EF05C|nr:DUF4256 domain-containing protein [Luteolibacter sp. SL250]WAC20078.1 DUF4256 domain-containing protein [Luteolibacter sp. SL250]
MSATPKKTLTAAGRRDLLAILENRFAENHGRHAGIQWQDVVEKLEKSGAKLWSLQRMEETGGEPDVIGHDPETGEFLFADCSAQSPKERMSLCYDREALESRKEHRPANSAMDLAAEMGVSLLTEEEYRHLQQLSEFDTKTSSWLKTPDDVRKLGGALFGDRRFGRTFIYHNGAQSYYNGRGFRGILRI